MNLLELHCRNGAPALDATTIATLLPQLSGWQVAGGRLTRSFSFANYRDTIAFVNVLAELAHDEDHHPQLVVNTRELQVAYCTHRAGYVVTINDAICAAKAGALYARRAGA